MQLSIRDDNPCRILVKFTSALNMYKLNIVEQVKLNIINDQTNLPVKFNHNYMNYLFEDIPSHPLISLYIKIIITITIIIIPNPTIN